VPPTMFDLHEDDSEATLDPEWRALIRQQAHMLTAMLKRFQTAGAGVKRRSDARSLRALAADAEQLAQLRALVRDLSQAPAALTQRVQRLERTLEVLHAHLATARQWLATMLRREA
jgi:hypothetical protein